MDAKPVGQAARALKALRERAGMSIRATAEGLGLPHTTYAGWETEFKRPFLALDRAKALMPILVGRGEPPVTEDEVLSLAGVQRASATTPPAKNELSHKVVEFGGTTYMPLPVFDVAASAGPGAMNVEHPEPEAWTLFGRDALRGLTRAPVDQLAIVRVSGDSMMPTLQNGDMILVDRTVRSMGRDGLYVIAAGPDVMVKRISRDWASKTLTITSDNSAYPASTGVGEEDIAILGRVVWLSRNVGG